MFCVIIISNKFAMQMMPLLVEVWWIFVAGGIDLELYQLVLILAIFQMLRTPVNCEGLLLWPSSVYFSGLRSLYLCWGKQPLGAPLHGIDHPLLYCFFCWSEGFNVEARTHPVIRNFSKKILLDLVVWALSSSSQLSLSVSITAPLVGFILQPSPISLLLNDMLSMLVINSRWICVIHC